MSANASTRSDMPQEKDPASTKAREQATWKRARGAISCAECRRLKLKCDRIVPCSSCRRRGCAHICPNGSLVTGQGTRFVLADTDRLHNKITEMSTRIRQLEDALALSHFNSSRDPHPLLSRENLKVKSIIDLHAAPNAGPLDGETNGEGEGDGDDTPSLDIFGTLALRDDGGSTFYGRSAGQEGESDTPEGSPAGFQDGESSPSIANVASVAEVAATAGTSTGLPTHVLQVSSAFPDASVSMPRYTLEAYLPPYARAVELIALYLEIGPWFFGAVKERQLNEELIPMFYPLDCRAEDTYSSPSASGSTYSAQSPSNNSDTQGQTPNSTSAQPSSAAQSPAAAFTPGSTGGASQSTSSSSLPDPTPHDLSLLFIIFCFGALVDENLPAAPNNPEAVRYFLLTRAALALDPVLDRAPAVSTVQALSMMAIYNGLVANETSIESTWAYWGLAAKLCQSVNRDCARWKLSPAEVQKRRALFWELFITDCWQSLATGRLPTFALAFVDCELPQDTEQTLSNDGKPQHSFPYWKALFGKQCVSAVVTGIFTARPPKYSVIVEVDRQVRDLDLPQYAVDPPPRGAGLSVTMQHYMPINYFHFTLIYTHRTFFAQGLCDQPLDPLKSQYAPSILAGYRSSCDLLLLLREQFTLFPARIARFWVLWTHAFSASVMLALIPVRAPQSKLAHTALMELKLASDLFEEAAPYGGRAGKMLPVVKRHLSKAYNSFQTARSQLSKTPEGIFAHPDRDEFSMFSGVTHTVNTRTKMQPPRLKITGKSSSTPASTSGGSGSAHGSQTGTPSTTMHTPDMEHPEAQSQSQQGQGHNQLRAQSQGHSSHSQSPSMDTDSAQGQAAEPSHVQNQAHTQAHQHPYDGDYARTQSESQDQQQILQYPEYPEQHAMVVEPPVVAWGQAHLHASLVDQLATFDRTLDAQISSGVAQPGVWQGMPAVIYGHGHGGGGGGGGGHGDGGRMEMISSVDQHRQHPGEGEAGGHGQVPSHPHAAPMQHVPAQAQALVPHPHQSHALYDPRQQHQVHSTYGSGVEHGAPSGIPSSYSAHYDHHPQHPQHPHTQDRQGYTQR
ncbi:uncharacterized protein STEHIDRAFT_121038, partial [Stereum hirsutum FP-91666 SS1]|uniref:uncharacterized protein n=1 Tax=Stereum hirsutum (strain FP-91666) TaxID=721885 RepID=UPI000440E6A8